MDNGINYCNRLFLCNNFHQFLIHLLLGKEEIDVKIERDRCIDRERERERSKGHFIQKRGFNRVERDIEIDTETGRE